MHFVNLKATNFLSFKELDYDFKNYPILIQGENLSEDSQESNGSGKSALQAAINFCLDSSTSRKVRDSELIFFGEEQARVELTIKCPIRNQILGIKRVIKSKGSNELKISINSIGQDFATINDGNKLIIEWIGISKEDLQNYFIINKERYRSFFSASNKEKIEMINRFSNAKLIDGVDKIVQSDVSNLEDELGMLQSDKTALIATIKTLKSQIDYELSRDLKAESQTEIDNFNVQIKKYQSDIDLCNEDIENKKILIDAIKQSIPENKRQIRENQRLIEEKNTLLEHALRSLEILNDFSQADDYLILDEKIEDNHLKSSNSKSEKKKLDISKTEIEEILSDIEKNLMGTVVCPKCSHEFLPGNVDIDIQEEKQAKIDTEALLERTLTNISSIKQQLEELDSQSELLDKDKERLDKKADENFEKKQEIKRQIDKIEKEITSYNTDIKTHQRSIDDRDENILKYQKQIDHYNTEISDLKLSIIKAEESIEKAKDKQIDHKRIADIRAQMKTEGKRLHSINSSIKSQRDRIFETSQWIFNFKKFNMHLANQSLKVIQGYCNKFLQSINSDIQIRWEGIKMLANGTLREEITPYIIRDSEQRDFWSFSGGERGRMEYSMILTLQRMINSTHKYGGLDFLSCDEISEGIDSQGLIDLMKALSTLQKTILITTHVVNRSVSSNVLLVRKEKGISKLILN